MTPTRAVDVLIEAGIIPPDRRSSAAAVLHAAEASAAYDFDELELRASDTEPPTCAPTMPPPGGT